MIYGKHAPGRGKQMARTAHLPHRAECSAASEPSGMTPGPHPSYPISLQGTFLPQMKEVLRETLWRHEKSGAKTGEALKAITIHEFKNHSEWRKRCLDRCAASHGESFAGDWSLNI